MSFIVRWRTARSCVCTMTRCMTCIFQLLLLHFEDRFLQILVRTPKKIYSKMYKNLFIVHVVKHGDDSDHQQKETCMYTRIQSTVPYFTCYKMIVLAIILQCYLLILRFRFSIICISEIITCITKLIFSFIHVLMNRNNRMTRQMFLRNYYIVFKKCLYSYMYQHH